VAAAGKTPEAKEAALKKFSQLVSKFPN